jgi:hypothetical protein
MGPIVWSDAYTDQEGTRHTDFARVDVAPLPPELSGRQQTEMVGYLFILLQDFVLQEVANQFGVPVSEREFLEAPEWQSRVHKILIIKPADRPATVYFNGKVDGREIPAGCGSALLIREGYRWHIKLDWLPLFPEHIQEQVRTSVLQLSEAILAGDEKSATEMARLWFPGTWEDSPKSIRQQLHKEIFVILFHAMSQGKGGHLFNAHPLDAIPQSFHGTVEGLKADYTLESLKAESQERPGFASMRFDQAEAEMNTLFSKAKLSERELRIMRLEAVLAALGEQWSAEDKGQHLGLKPGTYGAALYRAREKLTRSDTTRAEPLQRLLKAIFSQQAE